MPGTKLGGELRKYMHDHVLTQTQLGVMVGVDQSTVNSWVADDKPSRPRDANLRRVAELLGKSPADVTVMAAEPDLADDEMSEVEAEELTLELQRLTDTIRRSTERVLEIAQILGPRRGHVSRG